MVTVRIPVLMALRSRSVLTVGRLVVGEAIGGQADWFKPHLFLRGGGINRELRAGIGILLRARPACLVVNQPDARGVVFADL